MIQRLTSFAEDMQEKQIPYGARVLSREMVPALLSVAARLQLAAGSDVIHLERLGSTNGDPLVIADCYLPRDLCPGIMERDLADFSLYDILEKEHGLSVAKARRTLQAASPTAYETARLQIKPGDSIHLMKTVSYLASGRPVEHSRLRFRGDRSRFVFTLYRSRPDR